MKDKDIASKTKDTFKSIEEVLNNLKEKNKVELQQKTQKESRALNVVMTKKTVNQRK